MIVLDCSAAIDIVRETSRGKVFAQLMTDGERVISSDLFHAEMANTFWKYSRAGYCSEEEANVYREKATRLVDEFFDVEDCCQEALREATRLDHPVYDMLYFVLARRMGATLFTLDKKLAVLCDREGVDCVQEVAF